MKRNQIFVVLGTILIIVLFFFIGGTVNSKDKKLELSASKAKLVIAMNYVENSSQPMKGILMLKHMLEDNPENIEAIHYLGRYAVKSGQYEKAIDRYQTLVSKIKNPIDKVGVYFELGNVFISARRKDKAIEAFSNIKKLTTDKNILEVVDENINSIKNN